MTVQYANLSVDATVHVGSRALPSVWNSYRSTVEASLWAILPHVVNHLPYDAVGVIGAPLFTRSSAACCMDIARSTQRTCHGCPSITQ